jgi:hypothetical protein
MSWLFSRALVEAYSEENSSDGEQSAPLNGNDPPQAYCAPDKMTAFSRLSRFGMTYKPLTESRGEELLTLYLAGFHAKTYPQQEKAQDSMEQSLVCGLKCGASLAKYSQDLHMWRTQAPLFPGDCKPYLGTFPKWGLMQSGELFQLLPSALPMIENVSGLWLPTPTAHNAKEGNYPADRTRNTPTLAACLGGKINPQFSEWMMGFPLGWTDLKPLGTGRFPFVLRPHSDYLEAAE